MPRRPASPAVVVVLAVVGALLAGVAGTGSYLGVSQYLQGRSTNPGASSTATSTAIEYRACPQTTIDMVKEAGHPGELVTVLYVRGDPVNAAGNPDTSRVEAESWVCRDSDGTLYYQGHDINNEEINTGVAGPGLGALYAAHTNLRPTDGTVTKPGDADDYIVTVATGQYFVGCANYAFVRTNGNVRFGFDPTACAHPGEWSPTELATPKAG